MKSVQRGEKKYLRRMKQATYTGLSDPDTKRPITRPTEKDLGESKQPKITNRFKQRAERTQVRTELSGLCHSLV